MFVDMVGSTRIKADQGIQPGLWAIRQHNRYVWDLVQALQSSRLESRDVPSAYVVKYVGDEVMVSLEDDLATDAINTALAIVSHWREFAGTTGTAEIASKIGIAAGEVIPFLHSGQQGLPDPHGIAVDTAARLVSIAKPGQILVDANVRALVIRARLKAPNGQAAGFVPSDGIHKALKGVKGPVSVSEVVAGDLSSAQHSIENLHALRPELKKLEEALTDLLGQAAQVLDRAIDELNKRNYTGINKARTLWAQLNQERGFGGLHRVRAAYEAAVEVQLVTAIASAFSDVMRTYDQAADGLTGRQNLFISNDNVERQNGILASQDDMQKFLDRVGDMQMVADKYIRRIDGT